METIQTVISVIPLIVAIIAIFGWTYKLNRDLRLDLQKEMRDNHQQLLSLLQTHVHSTETNEAWFRAMVNQ